MCESLYRHYRLPDGRLVHMYLTDQLHEQVTGLADPHLPPPLILDDLCQVRVPPPPPPPRVVHDNSKATGRRGSYTVSALHAQRSKLDRSSSSKGSGALAVLAGVAGAKAAMRWRHSMRVRACVVLPYRFKAPLSISPDTFGPAPPLPQDDPPLFIVVRHRRRYRHKDLKGELAKQAALFRQRKKGLLQQHVVTRNNSKRFAIAKADRRTIRDGKPTGKKGKKKKNDRLIRAKLLAGCGHDAKVLEATKTNLRHDIRVIYDVFDYFCIMTSGDAFAMRGNSYREFIERCHLLGTHHAVPKSQQRPLSRVDCDTVFQ